MRALPKTYFTLAVVAMIGAGCGASYPSAATQTQPLAPQPQTTGRAHLTSADIAPRSDESTSLALPPEFSTAPPKETAGTPLPVGGPTGKPVPARSITDAQIATAIDTIIDGELAQARVASKRTRSTHVKALAEQIISDAGSVGADLTAFEARNAMAQSPSPTSDELRARNASTLVTLGNEHGQPFDEGYVSTQARKTAHLIELLDTTLIPEADSPELRGELAKLRAMLVVHEKMARDAQTADHTSSQ